MLLFSQFFTIYVIHYYYFGYPCPWLCRRCLGGGEGGGEIGLTVGCACIRIPHIAYLPSLHFLVGHGSTHPLDPWPSWSWHTTAMCTLTIFFSCQHQSMHVLGLFPLPRAALPPPQCKLMPGNMPGLVPGSAFCVIPAGGPITGFSCRGLRFPCCKTLGAESSVLLIIPGSSGLLHHLRESSWSPVGPPAIVCWSSPEPDWPGPQRPLR